MASENVAALDHDIAALLKAAPPENRERLTRYSAAVQREGRISVNMLQTTISSFLSVQEHWNMYEWAHSIAGLSPRTTDEILRERLGGFYDRRIAFDHHFENGEGFRYGALNIGGLGPHDRECQSRRVISRAPRR